MNDKKCSKGKEVFPNIEDLYDLDLSSLNALKDKIESDTIISTLNEEDDEGLTKEEMIEFVNAEIKERNTMNDVVSFFLSSDIDTNDNIIQIPEKDITIKDNDKESTQSVSTTVNNNTNQSYFNPSGIKTEGIKGLLNRTKIDSSNFQYTIGNSLSQRNAWVPKPNKTKKTLAPIVQQNKEKIKPVETHIVIAVPQVKKRKKRKKKKEYSDNNEEQTVNPLEIRKNYVVPDVKTFIKKKPINEKIIKEDNPIEEKTKNELTVIPAYQIGIISKPNESKENFQVQSTRLEFLKGKRPISRYEDKGFCPSLVESKTVKNNDFKASSLQLVRCCDVIVEKDVIEIKAKEKDSILPIKETDNIIQLKEIETEEEENISEEEKINIDNETQKENSIQDKNITECNNKENSSTNNMKELMYDNCEVNSKTIQEHESLFVEHKDNLYNTNSILKPSFDNNSTKKKNLIEGYTQTQSRIYSDSHKDDVLREKIGKQSIENQYIKEDEINEEEESLENNIEGEDEIEEAHQDNTQTRNTNLFSTSKQFKNKTQSLNNSFRKNNITQYSKTNGFQSSSSLVDTLNNQSMKSFHQEPSFLQSSSSMKRKSSLKKHPITHDAPTLITKPISSTKLNIPSKQNNLKPLFLSPNSSISLAKEKTTKYTLPQKPQSAYKKQMPFSLTHTTKFHQRAQSGKLTSLANRLLLSNSGNVKDYSKLYKNFNEIFNGYFLATTYSQAKNFSYEGTLSSLYESFKQLLYYEKNSQIIQEKEMLYTDIVKAEAGVIQNRLKKVSDKLLNEDDCMTSPEKYYILKKVLELEKKNYSERKAEGDNQLQTKLFFRVVLSRPEIYDIVCYVLGIREDWTELPHGLALGYCWNLLWTYAPPNIDFTKIFSFQKVNHLINNRTIHRKDMLKKHIMRIRNMNKKLNTIFDIMPQTFLLAKEYMNFIEEFHRIGKDNPLNLWIVKPIGKSRGKGIFIIDDISDVPLADTFLVQKYLTNPLLLEGYKFDMRIYVLVTSVNPLEVFLYKDGFARVSNEKFDLFTKNTKIHLTNAAIQNGTAKKSSNYEKVYGGSKISLDILRYKLSKNNNIDFNKQIWPQVKSIILKALIACQFDIPYCPSCFELFGFDIIIDQNLKCWLLEINSSPSLERSNALDDQVKLPLVDDILNIVDPINIDREALIKVLERVMKIKNTNNNVYLYSPMVQLNMDLTQIFQGKMPRAYGEMPSKIGRFERIAPSKESDRLIKISGGQKMFGGKRDKEL